MSLTIRNLFFFGLMIPIILYSFDYYMKQFNVYKPTQLGITQQQISKTSKDTKWLIDRDSGALALNGWDLNIEDDIFVNYQDATTLSTGFYQINNIRYKAWDYVLIHTPSHVIQVIFVDITLACPSNVIIFEKSNPKRTMKRVEEIFLCPEFDLQSMTFGSKGVKLDSKQFKAKISQADPKSPIFTYTFSSEPLALDFSFKFNYSEVASTMWTIPLSQDKTTWFAAMKKPGLSVQGSYKYNGQKYECANKDCLMMIDNGRGHQNYGIAYYWVMLMHQLQDGRVVTINLSDGFGTHHKSLEKASEDFIMIDGVHYKLDLHTMDYDKEKLVTKKSFYTAKETDHYKRVYPERTCEIKFEPIGDIEEGVNAIVIAFKQYLIYGYFDVNCNIDGEIIKFQNAYGHVEHVWSRW